MIKILPIALAVLVFAGCSSSDGAVVSDVVTTAARADASGVEPGVGLAAARLVGMEQGDASVAFTEDMALCVASALDELVGIENVVVSDGEFPLAIDLDAEQVDSLGQSYLVCTDAETLFTEGLRRGDEDTEFGIDDTKAACIFDTMFGEGAALPALFVLAVTGTGDESAITAATAAEARTAQSCV